MIFDHREKNTEIAYSPKGKSFSKLFLLSSQDLVIKCQSDSDVVSLAKSGLVWTAKKTDINV